MYYVLEKGFFSQFIADELMSDQQQDCLRLSYDGTVLGFFSMPMVELLSSPQMRREGSFQLEGHLEDASIRIQIAIRVIDCCDQVLDNASLPRIPLPENVLVVSNS
jgi:hypothetical protein